MEVSFLITGNEVVSARVRDTNAYHFAKSLKDSLGLSPKQWLFVEDSEPDVCGALEYLSAISDFVIMTGGLGPTTDDMTAQILAKYAQVPLVFHDGAWRDVQQAYTSRGYTRIPETNKKQAMFPQGSQVIPNHLGTAPGIQCQLANVRKTVVFALPGVPFEALPMLKDCVLPAIKRKVRVQKTTKQNWYHFFGIGESLLQEKLMPLERQLDNPHVSYRSSVGLVTVAPSCENPNKLKNFDCFVREELSEYLLSTYAGDLETLFQQIIRKYPLSVLEINASEGVLDSLLPTPELQLLLKSYSRLNGVGVDQWQDPQKVTASQPKGISLALGVFEQLGEVRLTASLPRGGDMGALTIWAEKFGLSIKKNTVFGTIKRTKRASAARLMKLGVTTFVAICCLYFKEK